MRLSSYIFPCFMAKCPA